MPNSEIIKEFLYHSLSDEQLSNLEKYFKTNKTNVDLDPNSIQSTVFAEIKLFGGIGSSLSESHLDSLKSDGTPFLFRNYRGRNHTEIIHLNRD
jgi:hypothetical protein